MIVAIPTYSWEVSVVAHELGHSFGSPHTHSCLWPGGAIDSCASSEEGSCFETVRGTRGTIMSYCHRAAGGSVSLNFHPLTSRLMRAVAEQAMCIGNEKLPTIYSLTGVLKTENNQVVPNLAIRLRVSEPGGLQRELARTTTDNRGAYSFTNLASGSYSIQLPESHVFSDIVNRGSIIVAGENATANFSIVPAYSVSLRSNIPISHFITIVGDRINGSLSQSNSNNKFTFQLPSGAYSIIATAPEYIFSNTIQQFTVTDRNLELADFSGTSAPNRYSIHGKVYVAEGNAGIGNVTISAVGRNSSRTAITDANGAYIINNLTPDEYRVTASSTQFGFTGSWIAQITNNNVGNTDFRANPIPLCSPISTLTAMTGTFRDRSDGSATYKANTRCSWLIAPPNSTGKVIRLSFTTFNTEDCCDIVTVYNGSTNDAPILGEFSGDKLPESVTSTHSAMLVEFRTNSVENYAGWTANYSVLDRVQPPNLLSPINNSIVPFGQRIELSWTAVQGAISYRVQASYSSNFTNVSNFLPIDTTIANTALKILLFEVVERLVYSYFGEFVQIFKDKIFVRKYQVSGSQNFLHQTFLRLKIMPL